MTRFGIAIENFLRAGDGLAGRVSLGEPPLLMDAAAVMLTRTNLHRQGS